MEPIGQNKRGKIVVLPASVNVVVPEIVVPCGHGSIGPALVGEDIQECPSFASSKFPCT